MARTRLSAELSLDGTIESEGDVAIAGRLHGDLTLKGTLTIDAGAHVKGDVVARAADIHGALEGDVVASERIQIHAEGQVLGDLRSRRILIADGAEFSGNVDMDRRGEGP